MFKTLLEQLQLCSATSSLQVLFAQPAILHKKFFPPIHQINKKRQLIKKEKTHQDFPKKSKPFGSIINTTGKRITLPKGLNKNYCANFLDAGEICKHGDNCHFIHAFYPNGFTEHNRSIIEKFVQNTDGLSFNKNESQKQDLV